MCPPPSILSFHFLSVHTHTYASVHKYFSAQIHLSFDNGVFTKSFYTNTRSNWDTHRGKNKSCLRNYKKHSHFKRRKIRQHFKIWLKHVAEVSHVNKTWTKLKMFYEHRPRFCRSLVWFSEILCIFWSTYCISTLTIQCVWPSSLSGKEKPRDLFWTSTHYVTSRSNKPTNTHTLVNDYNFRSGFKTSIKDPTPQREENQKLWITSEQLRPGVYHSELLYTQQHKEVTKG